MTVDLRILCAAILVAAFASLAPLASPARAAPCSSTWNNALGGAWETPGNWTPSGVPLTTDDVCIEADGTYTVTLGGPQQVASLTIGSTSASGAQTLAVANTVLRADTGITNGVRGVIALDCPGACTAGAPGLDVQTSTLTNAGTINVNPAAAGTGGFAGNLTNSGTINVNGSSLHAAGTGPTTSFLNQGTLAIATGVVFTSAAPGCDATVSVVNGTGGKINATGTGTLAPSNYTQGAGTTTGTAPVTLSCGTLAYTGAGSGRVLVTGPVSLSGASHGGQALTISGASATAATGFTNGGAITLDCGSGGCVTPPAIGVGASTLTNTGSITVTVAASGLGGFAGTVVNSGTLLFNGNARLAPGSGPTTTFTQTAGQTTVGGGATFDLGPSGSAFGMVGGSLNGLGTIAGTVNNSGGLVSPGAILGTLTVTGDYAQGAGASLSVPVDGIAAGQYSKLTVGGKATLQGGLRLIPGTSYVAFAVAGDSIPILTSGGTLGGTFATTTVAPQLAAGRAFGPAYDTAGKRVNAVVSGGTPPVTTGPPGSGPGTTPTASGAAAPKLSKLGLSTKAFKAKQGTTLSVTASKAAALTVVLSQNARGRRVAGHCRLKARKGKRCTLAVRKATLKFKAKKGANRFKLSTKKLRPGRYTATITAQDAAGKASKAVHISFTIKRT